MAFKGVTITEGDTSESVEATILDRTDVDLRIFFAVFILFRLGLDDVVVSVLELHITVSLVLDEPRIHHAPVLKLDPASVLATAPIVVPGTLVRVAIQVIVVTLATARTLFDLSFKVLSVCKEDFRLPVCYFPAIELALYDLIRETEKNSDAAGSVFPPLAFVE